MKIVGPDTMNAPWGLESRTKLVELALDFFDRGKYEENRKVIKSEKSEISLFTLIQFIDYIEKTGNFSKIPNVLYVMKILRKMSDAGIILNVGRGKGIIFYDYYISINTDCHARRGWFHLVPVLGGDFLYTLIKSSIVQITGKNENGDIISGSGMILDSHNILTCRHVIDDMEIDFKQSFHGKEYNIEKKHCHKTEDVAVITTAEELNPQSEFFFQDPVVSSNIFVIGYPTVPFSREPTLIIQNGSVTSEPIVAYNGENLFLYSAISRPGNSGGPIVSEDGYVVGIVSKDLMSKNESSPDKVFSPHYAGVPSRVIIKSLADMGLDINIPFEEFE